MIKQNTSTATKATIKQANIKTVSKDIKLKSNARNKIIKQKKHILIK